MRIFKEWAQFQAIFFENYENDALIPKLIPKMTAFSNQLGMPAIVNSKKQALFTWKVEDFKKLPAESAKFRRKSHVKEMLITLFTLSVYNMYAQNADIDHYEPVHVRKIADPSGTGAKVAEVISVVALRKGSELSMEATPQLFSNTAGETGRKSIGVALMGSRFVPISTYSW